MGFELLLPVILFILTLAIIFLLRSDDKRNQRTDLIKKRAQNLLKNVENSQMQFKESAQILEERISKKIEESHRLMGRVDSQLSDLEARSEDLAALQSVLATYQTSLIQLEETTTQVEQRVVMMKTEIATLSSVQQSLSDFDLRFEQFKVGITNQIHEGHEAISLQQLRNKELLEASFVKLKEYEREIGRVEQEAHEQVALHMQTLQNNHDASLALLTKQADNLQKISEEGELQMHLHAKAQSAAQIEALQELEEQQIGFRELQAEHAAQNKRHEEELLAIQEKARVHIAKQMEIFIQQISAEMGTLFAATLTKTDTSFQAMMRVVSQYLKELSSRLEQARGVTELLDISEHASLLRFKEDLNLLMEETLKGEQKQKKMQELEEETSSALALLNQEAQQLQEALATMKEEKLALLKKSKAEEIPSSVVFAMALVDETCKPQNEDVLAPKDEPAAQETERTASRLDAMTQSKERVEQPHFSAVFAMALVDEACIPLEKEQASFEDVPVAEKMSIEPVAEKGIPSVVSAMALREEQQHGKGKTKKNHKRDKEKKDAATDKKKQEDAEKHRLEYLAESEEEVIILDEDDTFSL